jgi:hypothetical protein
LPLNNKGYTLDMTSISTIEKIENIKEALFKKGNTK